MLLTAPVPPMIVAFVLVRVFRYAFWLAIRPVIAVSIIGLPAAEAERASA